MSKTLEEMMIDAGLPIAVDSGGKLLLKETRERAEELGPMLDAETFSRAWVQHSQRSKKCFIVTGSCRESGDMTCKYGPASYKDCQNWIRRNCDKNDKC